MKMYSNTLTAQDIATVVEKVNAESQAQDPTRAPITLVNANERISKVRANSFDPVIRGNNPVGMTGWDEDNAILARLYAIDPDLVVRMYYQNAAEFHERTCGRFIGLTGLPSDFHGAHLWSGEDPNPVMTNCSQCSAQVKHR